jgi:hypothetical protein
MGISNNLTEISKDFSIFGLTNEGNWVKFEIGDDYFAFLIIKK